MNYNKLLRYLNYTDHSYYDVHLPAGNSLKTEYINNIQTDIQYILRIYKNSILIAFRGTDSCKDVITDFDFFKMQVCPLSGNKKIRVHRGFFKAYTDSKIFEKISSCITDEIKTVEITGHSYGGALALICAADLACHLPDIQYEVVVFGTPRIGNKAFAKLYNSMLPDTIRIENRGDIITKLPPPIFGYCHAGVTYHIGPVRFPVFYSFKEHSLCSYRRNIFRQYLPFQEG